VIVTGLIMYVSMDCGCGGWLACFVHVLATVGWNVAGECCVCVCVCVSSADVCGQV
jgi:hypothetical protein